MTLQEYISFWQETYDKHQSRPTTYAAHNYVFKNHILPGLGDIPLSELTSEMVGEFLEGRRRFGNHRPGSSGLGEETMRHIHRLLQQCLDQAIRDGLLTENPAKAFHYRKSMTVKANIMTPLEMEDYLDAAERLGYLPMFMLALTAGLRQGELIALKWSDLDIESRTLTIAENRAVVRRELVEYGDQTRTIALTPEVIDLLIMEHAKHPNSPLMFMHPATQRTYSPQMVRRMHNEIIKEAGLDHIRFTDLRHTCAVLSLRNGVETKELTRMLGHYRPSITRQNYEPYLLSTAKKDENKVLVNQFSDVLEEDFSLELFLSFKSKILICTPEKLSYIIHHQADFLDEIGLYIFDEGHMFDDGSRGAIYELLISEIRSHISGKEQIILLSAVLSNAEQIQKWLLGEAGVLASDPQIKATPKTIGFASQTKDMVNRKTDC